MKVPVTVKAVPDPVKVITDEFAVSVPPVAILIAPALRAWLEPVVVKEEVAEFVF